MKLFAALLSLLVLLTGLSPTQTAAAETAQTVPVTFMCQNVRAPSSKELTDPVLSPAHRSELFKTLLAKYAPDVVGIQEAKSVWQDIFPAYEQDAGYSYVAATKINPDAQGYTAILYKTSRFSLLEEGVFWLTDTPSVPSTIVNRYMRNCTWAHLLDKQTGNGLYVFSTHLHDPMGTEADQVRAQQTTYLLANIAKVTAQHPNDPVLITGDFNARPDNDPNGANNCYNMDLEKQMNAASFRDVRVETKYGPTGSYHGWGKYSTILDYMFVSKAWTIRDFAVLEEKVNDEYVSDHYALLTHLVLPVTYTVTFAPGAQGAGTQAPLTKQPGTALTLPQAVFTRTGYHQTGWATQENGALVYALGAAYTADANVTLYPVWTKDAAPLIITTQPTDQTIDEGQTATFTVAATGDDVAYQWQINRNDGKGWIDLSGATKASYTTSAADKTCDGYQYRCHVTDTHNAALDSSAARLTVRAKANTPLVITTQPTDQTIDAGKTATFTVAATGDGVAYQWQINRNDGKGWVNLSGATKTSYTTSAADKTCDGYQYRCHVTDAYNASLTSAVATLTVHAALPRTGDASTPALWLGLLLLAGAGMFVMRKRSA